jgi:hypothetical protein
VKYATNLPDLLRLEVQMIIRIRIRRGYVEYAEYATDLPNLLRLLSFVQVQIDNLIRRPVSVWAMLLLHRSLRLRLLIMCQGRKGLG